MADFTGDFCAKFSDFMHKKDFVGEISRTVTLYFCSSR